MAGSDIIQSLANGIDVLILLAESEEGLRVKDVSQKVGVKPAVAHNLLRTLRVKGFVERDERSPIYRLGRRIEELVEQERNQVFFQSVENAMITLLKEFPDAAITFTRAINGEIMVKRRLHAGSYGIVQKPSGMILGLYTSASGLATLAFCSEECYLTLQQHHPYLEQASHIWSPPSAFDKCLDEIRRQGHAVHPNADHKRLAVACPIFDQKGELVGALGLSRTLAESNVQTVDPLAISVEKLKEAAQLIG